MGLFIGNPEIRYCFITKWMEKVVPAILSYESKCQKKTVKDILHSLWFVT